MIVAAHLLRGDPINEGYGPRILLLRHLKGVDNNVNGIHEEEARVLESLAYVTRDTGSACCPKWRDVSDSRSNLINA